MSWKPSQVWIFLIACAAAVGLYLVMWDSWEDRSGTDMPWLGRGSRARLYHRDRWCSMCPTGFQSEERWGRYSWSGESPYTTVSKAMHFLTGTEVYAAAPAAKGAGSIADDSGIITPRALPYHFTVVMIEPTVLVMNFDLGALIHEGEPQHGQVVGTPFLDGYVSFGTKIPATGTLMWFCPDEGAAPTIIGERGSGSVEIKLKKTKLTLVQRDNEWVVTLP